MRRETEKTTDSAGEAHMRNLRGSRIFDDAICVAPYFPQRPPDTTRIPGKLNCRGIGEKLSLARHRGLDQRAEEMPDVADHHDHQPDEEEPGRSSHGAAFLLTAPSGPGDSSTDPHEYIPEGGKEQDPGQDAHQADVEPHVAVENVAEFVGHHALQFIAIQPLDAAPAHCHRRVIDGIAGGEGVDSSLILQDVDVGDRHSGGDGHFLHDIRVFLFGEIACSVGHLDAPHHLGNRRSPGRQAGDLDQAGQAAGQKRASHHPQQGHRLPETTPWVGVARKEEGEEKIQDRDDPHNRQGEHDHQAPRRTTRSLLVFKEIHRHGLDSSRPGSFQAKAGLSLSILIRTRQVGRGQERWHGYAKGMGKGAQQLRLLYLDDPISEDTVTAGHQSLLANVRRRARQPAD